VKVRVTLSDGPQLRVLPSWLAPDCHARP